MSKYEKFKGVIFENSEEKTCIHTALDEWYLEYVNDTEEYGTNKCICSTPIKYEYHIVNMVNLNSVIVGSKCINKIERQEPLPESRAKLPQVVITISSIAKVIDNLSKKVVAFGKHSGNTFEELLKANPKHAEWFITNTSTPKVKKLNKCQKNMRDYRKYIRYHKLN
jgi:hypothetical protein